MGCPGRSRWRACRWRGSAAAGSSRRACSRRTCRPSSCGPTTSGRGRSTPGTRTGTGNDAGEERGMDEPIEVIPLPGFDPDGDPEIRRMADGSLWLVFNFMPPSWVPEEEYVDLGRCRDFDRQLEAAIGVPVVW